MLNKIFVLNPINKTASLVTNQKYCAADDILSVDQQLEALRAHLERLILFRASETRKSRIKELGEDIFHIQNRISELKKKNKKPSKSYEACFFEVAKKELSEAVFEDIQRKTKRLYRKHLNDSNKNPLSGA